MRITMLARNTSGIRAKLEARTVRQKRRLLAAVQEMGQEENALMVALANVDTGYMASKTTLRFTRGGYNYSNGYYRKDFVGQMNTLVTPPRLITRFYPEDVIKGTKRYAGNDFPAATRRIMRPRVLKAYSEALSGR